MQAEEITATPEPGPVVDREAITSPTPLPDPVPLTDFAVLDVEPPRGYSTPFDDNDDTRYYAERLDPPAAPQALRAFGNDAPSVGRIVHVYFGTKGPYAAIVTAVPADPEENGVGVAVFLPDTLSTSARVYDAPVQEGLNTWGWPPRV